MQVVIWTCKYMEDLVHVLADLGGGGAGGCTPSRHNRKFLLSTDLKQISLPNNLNAPFGQSTMYTPKEQDDLDELNRCGSILLQIRNAKVDNILSFRSMFCSENYIYLN